MDQLFIHQKLLGAILEDDGYNHRTIIAAWMETQEVPFRPVFVVLTVDGHGNCLKINLPHDDWKVTSTSCLEMGVKVTT